MRLPWKHSVPLWRAPAWLCAVFLLLTCPVAMAIEYDAGTAITDVSITNPAASEVWLAGSDHSLTCSTASDTDRCRPNAEAEWQDIADSVTHYWTGTGTFKDNDNIGTSVTYICTNTAGNNTVTVYANDNYAPDNNTAIVDETAKSDSETVSVIIPVIDQITYGGGNHTISDVTTPEYDRAASRNEPAAYTKSASSITASTTFWSSTALTESSGVDVFGTTTGTDVNHWGTGSGTFGTSWPSAAISNDGDVLCSTVKKATYTTTWKFRCPTGSNTWIESTTQSDHVIYVTLSTPGLAPTKQIIDYACIWADGASDADGACTLLLSNGFASHYTWDFDCHRLSSDFVRLASAIGITASQHKWASITPSAVNDMVYQRTEEFDPVGPTHGYGPQEWSWHQWSEAGGKQRDPSAAASLIGTWGSYEDDLFTDYRKVDVLTPLIVSWTPEQAGQTAGCEASAHRAYDGSPTIWTWRGPDR